MELKVSLSTEILLLNRSARACIQFEGIIRVYDKNYMIDLVISLTNCKQLMLSKNRMTMKTC